MAKKETEKIEKVDKEIKISINPEVEVAKAEQNVRIKPNQDINCYIGNQFYRLAKGQVVAVPKNVKDILQRAGMLDVL